MTEEEGPIENQYSTGRRGQNRKQSKDSLSSNPASNVSSANSIASASSTFFDLFHRTKRSHNKEKNSHRTDNGKRQSDLGNSSIQTTSTEREAAAIAVLENVLENDSYNSRSSASNQSENGAGSGSNKV